MCTCRLDLLRWLPHNVWVRWWGDPGKAGQKKFSVPARHTALPVSKNVNAPPHLTKIVVGITALLLCWFTLLYSLVGTMCPFENIFLPWLFLWYVHVHSYMDPTLWCTYKTMVATSALSSQDSWSSDPNPQRGFLPVDFHHNVCFYSSNPQLSPLCLLQIQCIVLLVHAYFMHFRRNFVWHFSEENPFRVTYGA